MGMAVTASEQDLRTLAAIVADDREDLPAQGLPLSLLGELIDRIRLPGAFVAVRRLTTQVRRVP